MQKHILLRGFTNAFAKGFNKFVLRGLPRLIVKGFHKLYRQIDHSGHHPRPCLKDIVCKRLALFCYDIFCNCTILLQFCKFELEFCFDTFSNCYLEFRFMIYCLKFKFEVEYCLLSMV